MGDNRVKIGDKIGDLEVVKIYKTSAPRCVCRFSGIPREKIKRKDG